MENVAVDILTTIIQSNSQIHNFFVDRGTSFKGTILCDLNWTQVSVDKTRDWYAKKLEKDKTRDLKRQMRQIFYMMYQFRLSPNLWHLCKWDFFIFPNLYDNFCRCQQHCEKVVHEMKKKLTLHNPEQHIWLRMRSSLLRMRSSLVVRASDCQCTSCNGPGFNPSIRRHSGIWGAADEAVLNTVRKKNTKSPIYEKYHSFNNNMFQMLQLLQKQSKIISRKTE